MPRWRPLPEELDPQVHEFASQLRRLVDRSGMSVAAIADRTGYSKSSWERYLNGRLLPPRGATQALAEVTGTDVRHLGTMWELAERAWSRAEMRHDVTMEAIRIAQARAALGEFGDDPGKGEKRGRLRHRAPRLRGAGGPHGVQESAVPEGAALESAGPKEGAAPPAPSPQEAAESGELDDNTAVLRPEAQRKQAREAQREKQRRAREAIQRAAREEAQHRAEQRQGDSGTRDRAPGSRSPGRGAPGKTPSPWAGTGSGSGPGSGGPQRVDLTSWGSGGRDAATRSKPSGAPAGRTPTGPRRPVGGAPNGGVSGAGSGGDAGTGAGAGSGANGAGGPGQDAAGKRRVTMFLAGIVGTLVLVAAAVLLFDLMDAGTDKDKPKSSPTVIDSKLPAGVKCQGPDCAGKDPESAGCGGQHARTSSSSYVGRSYVEVRYSKICQAAWARVTGAGQGDTLRVNAGKRGETDTVDATSDAYTEMVAAKSPDAARACLTLSAGGRGCTTPGTTSPSPPSEGR